MINANILQIILEDFLWSCDIMLLIKGIGQSLLILTILG